MNTVNLPPIFAVYRPETRSFSIYQPDMALNNVVHRLIPWYRPVKGCWGTCSDKERLQVRRWFEGQRWYILENQEPKKELYDVIIQKKHYTFWSLNHSLVWAKNFISIHDQCPSIPVLEFNSQKLVSSTNPGLHVIWNSIQSDNLLKESALGWGLIFDRLNMDSGAEKPLRIRTPVPKASESDKEQEQEQEQEDSFSIPVQPKTWIDTAYSCIGIGLYGCTAVTIVTLYASIVRTVIGF